MILTHHGIDSLGQSGGGGGVESEVTLGSINSSRYSDHFPWDGYYSYSLTQQIYGASEIVTTGKITDLSFYCFSGQLTWGVTIYMSHTSRSSLGSSSEILQGNSNVQDTTMVFSGSVSLRSSDNKWFKIPLSTQFEYNNSNNLLLTVCGNYPSNVSKELHFATHMYKSNTARYIGRSNSAYDPMTYSYPMSSDSNYRNTIKLNMLV